MPASRIDPIRFASQHALLTVPEINTKRWPCRLLFSKDRRSQEFGVCVASGQLGAYHFSLWLLLCADRGLLFMGEHRKTAAGT